jgi:predicted ATPase/class 3 adenylate cyclase
MPSVDLFAPYLSPDRYLALAQGVDLPNRAGGAALFADIADSTPLAETLAHELGSHLGSEETTRYLNKVYDVLIGEVNKYQGNVVSFSGDAITCWFDDSAASVSAATTVVVASGTDDNGTPTETAAMRATMAAFAMQAAIQQFSQSISTPSGKLLSLAIKVAVVAGPARRFVVGEPSMQRLDILAGRTLDRLAQAEHLAHAGEIVVGVEILHHLQVADFHLQEWRSATNEEHNSEPFAVVVNLKQAEQSLSTYLTLPMQPFPTLAQVKEWLLPTVYRRLEVGLGDFLTELRPVTALFLRFSGLDYDNDPLVEAKLDQYIRWVQGVVGGYEGTLLQVTMGDKGSYLYVAFGAPVAHQNDAERAVRTGLALLTPPTELAKWVRNIQIGVSQGTMRCGTYGGVSRHTYGALGDEVNLAARLMMVAESGQMVVSSRIYKILADSPSFNWQSLPPRKVKGKTEPINIFRVVRGDNYQSTTRFNFIQSNEPDYKLAMIGRTVEIELVTIKLEQSIRGQGQIVAILGEAGIGKSRLVAEAIKLAAAQNLISYGGECQSYGINSPYLVWQPIFRQFFRLDSSSTVAQQIMQLEQELNHLDPTLVPRLPLLSTVVGLAIPDNDLTKSFDAKLRKASLESLLADCLKARVKAGQPLLLVLEDCHWLDPASYDLLEVVGRAISDLPILLVVAYRPPELEHLQAPRSSSLSYSSTIELKELTASEAQQLIEQKLGRQTPIAIELVERITTKAGGNPFYIEEILNYFQDNSINLQDGKALVKAELPESLQSLVLSRIDRLSESEKGVLKVASIVGRVFAARWVWEVYPQIGSPQQVKSQLNRLAQLDITPQAKPEPDLTYLFKHAITQEVTYTSQSLAARNRLHERVGDYIERDYSENLDQYIDLLAYHYGHSTNRAKQAEYYKKAGDAAKASYANASALEYYRLLLELLADNQEQERMAVLVEISQILILTGEAAHAEGYARQALALTEHAANPMLRTRSQQLIGQAKHRQGVYQEALEWLALARTGWELLAELSELEINSEQLQEVNSPNKEMVQGSLLQVVDMLCMVYSNLGDYERMQKMAKQSLYLAQQWGHEQGSAIMLGVLGNTAYYRGDYELAEYYDLQSLAGLRKLGNNQALPMLLISLGNAVYYQGKYAQAEGYHREALTAAQLIGDRQVMAGSMMNLGFIALVQNDYATAIHHYQQSLALFQNIGDKRGIGVGFNNLAKVAVYQGNYTLAVQYCQESLTIRNATKDTAGTAYCLNTLGWAEYHQSQYSHALRSFQESLKLAIQMKVNLYIILNLIGLAATILDLHLEENIIVIANVPKKDKPHLFYFEWVGQWIGVATTLFSQQRIVLEPLERSMYEHLVALGRTKLGTDFEINFETGKTMQLEQVAERALALELANL